MNQFLNLDGVFLFIIFFLFFTVYLTILIKQNILSLLYFIKNNFFTLPVFQLHHYVLTLIIAILYLDLMGFGFCASITEIEKTNYSNLSSTNKPIYLDLNKTNQFIGDMYYFYKELLWILGTDRIFSTYGIDYDIDYFFLNDHFNKISSFYIQNSYLQQNSLFLLNNINHGSMSISKYLINLDELVLDLSVATLYWSNEPSFKFYIPYPFIASGNFHYHDYWWLHISVYYYWLWFFFIYLIIFFLITVMWEIDYNITKNNPQRETRGVSRSKCGDLITATVPVSWASAIIIHESTDSIDHFDGFGTLDFVVGIRAFQWGWEYYYPNNLKINYTMSNEKNILLGNDNLVNNESDEFIMSQHTKQLLMNKNKSINILPLYLITNPDLNKVYFNINKMGNFGFSKLCIYTAYKFTLKNKAINYNNILNSTVNLTNFNVKKFINHYKVDTTSSSSNFKQFKLPNNKSIKLFKKTYNKFDILKFNQTDNLQFNTNKLDLLNNMTLYSINFKTYTENICKLIQLNQKKLIINCENFINFDFLTYLKITNSSLDNFIRFDNVVSVKNNITNLFNYLKTNEYIETIFKLNNDKYSILEKYNTNTAVFNLKKQTTDLIDNFNFLMTNYFADLDFKRLQQSELLEDLYWDFYFTDLNVDETNSIINNIQEFHYLYKGFYEFDNNLFFKNYLNYINWYKLNINFFNVYQNSIINTDNSYKFLTLISKINVFFDSSFFIFKQTHLTHNTINLNTQTTDNKFNNIINSSYIFNNFSKFNQYGILTASSLINTTQMNVKLNLNVSLVDNIKNYNIMNNSFWKVFKYSYYDDRVFLNSINFSFNNFKLPIIDTLNTNTNSIINKNLSYFTKTYNLNKFFYKYSNIYLNKHLNMINLISFDLPFDVSSECDMFKYSWIDWYNFYNKKETKFQDLKEYNLNGSKLFFNKYDYVFNDNNDLMVVETYFNKLLNNRKNYTNIYNFIPYLLIKNNLTSNLINFNDIYSQHEIVNGLADNLLDILFFKYCFAFDKSVSLIGLNTSILNNINGFFSYNKNFLNTLNSWNNYNNYILMLNNILIKRSFLLKQLVFNNLNYNYFNLYNTSLTDNIIIDWKTSLVTNTTSILEGNAFLLKLIKLDNFMILDSYDFSKLFNSNKKTQYNHMRKSVNNMLRLQNDKAVCMPTDTRIQILTWSKDIIHSWAIPSAGIKIDCIPGYSSHKVFNLILSGIYYGQCMEICGRFHHWMPIVVYFTRRDLFLFWCTTFLNSKKNESTNINKKIKNIQIKVNLD